MTKDEKILKALEALQTDVDTIKTDHGKKLHMLLDGHAHILTAIETLDEKIEATKAEVDEIKKRQRPRHAD